MSTNKKAADKLLNGILENIAPSETDFLKAKMVTDDDNYSISGGENRGNTSIGIFFDMNLEENNNAKGKLQTLKKNAMNKKAKYQNIVFRDVSILKATLEETLETDDDGNQYILIPADIKPNKSGEYWINQTPIFPKTE